jgi:hypothetical protein
MASDAKDRAATDRPEKIQPTPEAVVKRAEVQRPPSEAAFIPTMLTGTLAVVLLLLGAIVKLARGLNKQDAWRTPAGWFDAYRQLRADPGAGFTAVPAKEPGGLLSRRAKRSDAANLKANLQQLLRDLRSAEAKAEPPRRFEPDGRRQLRLILDKLAARRSQLQAFNGEEGFGIPGHQSDPVSAIAHSLLRPRSAA